MRSNKDAACFARWIVFPRPAAQTRCAIRIELRESRGFSFCSFLLEMIMSTPKDSLAHSPGGYDLRSLSAGERSKLAERLNPEERRILLNQGTEPPFCGTLLNNKENGLYACRLCGLPLFKADNKFESGTGWPSFYQPYDAQHIREIKDMSHGMVRVEIRCQRCDGHLGHVFEDGPRPTGLRYCLNSVSLEFVPDGQPLQLKQPS